jgi:hypothetical protein
MTYLRVVLVLVGLPSAIASMAFALWDGPPSFALTLGGVAAVSVVAAWLLGLKADSDMERYRAGREEVWARRLSEAQWLDDYLDARSDDELLLQLPERFDAG